MRRGRAAGLAALAALLLVAGGRAHVQQEPFMETTEGTAINITCSHSSKRSNDYIHFYRQLPGRAPEFLATAYTGSKDVPAIAGRLSVSETGVPARCGWPGPGAGTRPCITARWGPRAEEPGLRPGTNRRGRGRAGPAGGAAAPPAGLPGRGSAAPSSAPSPLAPTPHGPARPQRASQPPATRARTLAALSPASPRSRARLCLTPNCCGLRLCRRLSPSGHGCCCSQPALQSQELLLDSTWAGS